MAVRYTSPHHSEEDPGGLVREVLELGADFPGPAADIFLSWSLRLADDVPAAVAAERLLERYGLRETPRPSGACGELVALLLQAAEGTGNTPNRRRGGWRAKRN
ncbi:MAG: hypothetical protein Kilf2KO_11550 [Rhodospirillales bacterium]